MPAARLPSRSSRFQLRSLPARASLASVARCSTCRWFSSRVSIFVRSSPQRVRAAFSSFHCSCSRTRSAGSFPARLSRCCRSSSPLCKSAASQSLMLFCSSRSQAAGSFSPAGDRAVRAASGPSKPFPARAADRAFSAAAASCSRSRASLSFSCRLPSAVSRRALVSSCRCRLVSSAVRSSSRSRSICRFASLASFSL